MTRRELARAIKAAAYLEGDFILSSGSSVGQELVSCHSACRF